MSGKTITEETLKSILDNHKLWLEGKGGARAKLSNMNLSYMDLTYAVLDKAMLLGVDFRHTNLYNASLKGAYLSLANFAEADLCLADLSGADLTYTIFDRAILTKANFTGANLGCADLTEAFLNDANLSQVTNFQSPIDIMNKYFDHTDEGYIVYKTFNNRYPPPEDWVIEPHSIITETANFNRSALCACGINVTTLSGAKLHYSGDIWKCLIRWEQAVGICVPYSNGGSVRCERLELLEIVDTV